MKRHIYAYGSICRGEFDVASDYDVLAIVSDGKDRPELQRFSVYSHERVAELWEDGNPFAWHLCIESRLLYASDGVDYIRELGRPSLYSNVDADCGKFRALFSEALCSFVSDARTQVYDLSAMFLAIRNFATCYLLGVQRVCEFSRHAALRMGAISAPITPTTYNLLMNARIISTRGIGEAPATVSAQELVEELNRVADWMARLQDARSQ